MLKKYEEKESREESARMAKIAKSKAQVEESNKYYNQDANQEVWLPRPVW